MVQLAPSLPALESACTFFWHGEADAVSLAHQIEGIEDPLPLHRQPGSTTWSRTLLLPRDSRLEYRFLLYRNHHTDSILDPHNPHLAHGPFGSNSVIAAPEYQPPPWTLPNPAAPAGELHHQTIYSPELGRLANFSYYLPAHAPRRGLPLLIIHDGADYLQYTSLRTILDNLIHHRLMADTLVVFTNSEDRLNEYNANPAHSRFLANDLVPSLQRNLPLRPDPASRFLAGSSLGAIASLAAALDTPHFYAGLLLQSPSFFPPDLSPQYDHPLFASLKNFTDRLQSTTAPITTRIFQTIAAFEPTAPRNRNLFASYKNLTHHFQVQENQDGHNWTSWRDQLQPGLSFLLPAEV